MHIILVYMKEFMEIIEELTKISLEEEARATARFVETLAELGTLIHPWRRIQRIGRTCYL
jgi:hypothetical protein